jgi:hypothetical protein
MKNNLKIILIHVTSFVNVNQINDLIASYTDAVLRVSLVDTGNNGFLSFQCATNRR